MNLFEITDEFNQPKHLPEDDLKHLEVKEKRLRYEMQYIRDQNAKLSSKIIGEVRKSGWGFNDPNDPAQKEEIDKIIAQGFIPVTTFNQWSGKDEISSFVRNVPENKDTIEKIMRLKKRESIVAKMIHEIPTEIKRAKGRLSAWKRKQPNYVGRSTGKELLAEIKKQVEQHIAEKSWPVTINNSYYWAKNKMIVIDIPVRTGIDGKSPVDTAKTVIKPGLTKFLEDLGYTQFRVVDRWYPDSRLMIVKIQLDDVEAKNKAAGNETV